MRYLLALTVLTAAVGFAIVQSAHNPPWSSWRDVMPWGSGHGMMGHGGMGHGMMGGSQRHAYAMMNDVPAAYRSASNPLPRTESTVARGAGVYEQYCETCHGRTGWGDGPASEGLNPRPADLAGLSRMPMVDWDAFMDWTISEGGGKFGTAMPAFKTVLSKDDSWAVIAYVQAQLPQHVGRK